MTPTQDFPSFAEVLFGAQVHDKQCYTCRTPQASTAAKMKRCGLCHLVRYCGTACQKEDWRNHKVKCLQFYRAKTPFVGDIKTGVINCRGAVSRPFSDIIFDMLVGASGGISWFKATMIRRQDQEVEAALSDREGKRRPGTACSITERLDGLFGSCRSYLQDHASQIDLTKAVIKITFLLETKKPPTDGRKEPLTGDRDVATYSACVGHKCRRSITIGADKKLVNKTPITTEKLIRYLDEVGYNGLFSGLEIFPVTPEDRLHTLSAHVSVHHEMRNQPIMGPRFTQSWTQVFRPGH